VSGFDIVDGVTRLCAMNLYLHGIGGHNSPVTTFDSLASPPSTNYEIVLTNPPFGKKSSITVINEEGEESKEKAIYYRDDFWATTSNKQLNFLQHVRSLLKIHGRAAIVVPDNVLFEGGAAGPCYFSTMSANEVLEHVKALPPRKRRKFFSAHPHLRPGQHRMVRCAARFAERSSGHLTRQLDTGLSHRSTMGRAPQSPRWAPQPRCITCLFGQKAQR
jgi:tRNA G10  N-methylase Trm11